MYDFFKRVLVICYRSIRKHIVRGKLPFLSVTATKLLLAVDSDFSLRLVYELLKVKECLSYLPLVHRR